MHSNPTVSVNVWLTSSVLPADGDVAEAAGVGQLHRVSGAGRHSGSHSAGDTLRTTPERQSSCAEPRTLYSYGWHGEGRPDETLKTRSWTLLCAQWAVTKLHVKDPRTEGWWTKGSLCPAVTTSERQLTCSHRKLWWWSCQGKKIIDYSLLCPQFVPDSLLLDLQVHGNRNSIITYNPPHHDLSTNCFCLTPPP